MQFQVLVCDVVVVRPKSRRTNRGGLITDERVMLYGVVISQPRQYRARSRPGTCTRIYCGNHHFRY